MDNRLSEIYEDGRRKGWIKESPSKWRGQVIGRINKMYKKNYHNLSDEEIIEYIEVSKFFKP